MPQESLQEILESIRAYFPGACEDCPFILALAKTHKDAPRDMANPHGTLEGPALEVVAEGIGKIAYGLCPDGSRTKVFDPAAEYKASASAVVNCGLGLRILNCIKGVTVAGYNGTAVSANIPDALPDNFK